MKYSLVINSDMVQARGDARLQMDNYLHKYSDIIDQVSSATILRTDAPGQVPIEVWNKDTGWAIDARGRRYLPNMTRRQMHFSLRLDYFARLHQLDGSISQMLEDLIGTYLDTIDEDLKKFSDILD